ncbi:Odorant receptor 19 [Ephemera danica]|nr:Odorant receptor 19 [Ephemera danica]
MAAIRRANEIGLGIGFRVLGILSIVFGQLFNIHPINIRKRSIAYYVTHAYTFIMVFYSSFITIGGLILILKNSSNFSVVVYYSTGFLGVAKCCLRSYFLILKKRRIELFTENFRRLLNESWLKSHQRRIIFRLTRYILILYAFLMSFYVCAMITNFNALITRIKHANETNSIAVPQFFKDATNEVMNNMWLNNSNISRFFDNLIPISISMVLVYSVAFLCIGKLITSDVLFYASYWLIIKELELLISKLKGVIRRSSTEELTLWLNYHHKLEKLLLEINNITSLPVFVSVIFTAIQLCFVAVVIVKRFLQDSSDSISLLLFAITSMQQLFMFCLLGQKIREQLVELQRTAYSAPWLRSQRGMHSALMICNAATERAMPLPGAPFFALSLEFFASIMGVVVTYFIVLLQFNKE